MHVNGQGKQIRDIDLNAVLRGGEDSDALALVRSLDLAHNSISTVRGLDCLASLSSLDLAHNHISSIVSLPPTITRLNLSHNQLTADALFESQLLERLPLLRELDLSNNRIGSLARIVSSGNDRGGVPPCNIQYLRMDNNRIASLDGIHIFGASLRIASFEGNYISSLSDIRKLQVCPLLQAISFERCPVTDTNRYREAVSEACPSLLTLDGTPLQSAPSISRIPALQRQREQDYDEPHVVGHAAPNAGNQQGLRGVPVALDDLPNLQRDGAMRNTASKIHELTRLNKELRLTVQHQTETSTFLERDNAQLRQQLSEARRVIAEQLDKMAILESQRDAARLEAQAYASQLQRAGAQLEHSRHNAATEKRKLLEDQERSRVRGLFQDQLDSYLAGRGAQVRDSNSEHPPPKVRKYTRPVPRPSTANRPVNTKGAVGSARVATDEEVISTLLLKQRDSLRHNASITSSTNLSAASNSPSAAGSTLADQMKKWVRQEVDSQLASHTS